MELGFWLTLLVGFPFSYGISHQTLELLNNGQKSSWFLESTRAALIIYPVILILSMTGYLHYEFKEKRKSLFICSVLFLCGWLSVFLGVGAYYAT